MPSESLQVVITSSEDILQSDQRIHDLLGHRLATGNQNIHIPTSFLWLGEVPDLNYYDLEIFALQEVNKNSSLEPMVSFTELNGHHEIVIWIDEKIERVG